MHHICIRHFFYESLMANPQAELSESFVRVAADGERVGGGSFRLPHLAFW